MSKTHQVRSCGNKKRHYNRRQAELHMFSLINSGRGGDPKTLMVYHCSFCKKYHVGHGY